MSFSKPQTGVKRFCEQKPVGGSDVLKTPILAERHDRFCTECSCVIENMALEKFPNMQCRSCQTEVEFLHKSDWAYNRCVKCSVFLRCTAKFCYMCGRYNQHYDPNKPDRLLRAQQCKMREVVLKEQAAAALAKTCLKDGDWKEDDEEIESKGLPKKPENKEPDATVKSE